MKTYEITSEVRGTEQFLVVRQEQEKNLNEYLVKMLEYNSIAGILPLKSQNMNGRTMLNYQLGNRFKLIDLIRQDRIGSGEARLIYDRLTSAIAGMGEYFLNADQCVYELDYLYVDATLNPYMLYLPFEDVRNHEINRVWREFFLNLLSYFSDGKQDPFYDRLMRYLIQPNFNLRDFRGVLMESAGEEAPQLVSVQEQMNYTAPVDKPVAPVQASAPVAAAVKESVSAAPGGVAIPGRANSAVNIPGAAAKSAEPPVSGNQAKPVTPTPGKSGNHGISIPGISGGKKQVEAQEPVAEKPSKEKKQGSLFGFGKKKPDPEVTAPLPVIPQAQSAAPAGPQTSGNADGESWSKTMMIKPVVEEKRTVMLNAAQPHLLHNGSYVPIGQFPFTIGKGNASYIVANQTVSRLHATLLQQGNGYAVRDENSTNHTYLNGMLLEPGKIMELHDGDHLRMSNEEFTFHTS